MNSRGNRKIPSELNGKVILVVDDNPTNLSVLSVSLKSSGFKVRVAIDGISAIEQVIESPPELILLDVQMPGIDGFETCTRLKSNTVTKDIPIIFITASTSTESKIKGLSLGAVDYITKPFQQEEVLARVQVHLKLRYLTKKVQDQAIALKQANLELLKMANLDGLTQVSNRRRFDQYLDQEWRRLARMQEPLSLVMCDIDYFKLYNDCYGHLAGDLCLQKVAKVILACLKRPADLLSRYGGEEFAVILPETDLAGALRVAEDIRTHVNQLQVEHIRSDVSSFVSLSLGAACQIPTPTTSSTKLIGAADSALYSAKTNGRNRVFPVDINVQSITQGHFELRAVLET